jgi:hypothetical protein
MRTTSLLTLFGMALCVGTTLVACGGDDDAPAPAAKPSGEGQSCARTADCASKLVCVDQVCQKSGSSSGGNAGTDGSGGTGGSTGGTGGKGGTSGKGGTGGSTPAPVLGGEGESCTRAADCETGLGCFNQRCVSDGSMMGGGGEAGSGGVVPPPAPPLGRIGETCVLPSDCAAGLTCVPGGVEAGNLGICSITNSGLTATGKTCFAECETDEDCCELPLEIQAALTIKSCADLDDLLSGVDCMDPGSFAPQCFAQSTYCTCGTSTWRCTSGSCVYNAVCEADGLTTLGCATYSRSGRLLPTTCVDGDCGTIAVDPICSSDAECETLTVADDPYDTCSPGECTCFGGTGNCYRKCAENIDCAVGFVCDTATDVCVAAPECDNDFDCQRDNRDVDWFCTDNGACAEACSNDLDCNEGDISDGGLVSVCNDNLCMPLGCQDNDDCTALPVRMFCDTPPAVSTTAVVPRSAITGGM